MDKVLKGHEKINELVTKYHEVKASIVEAIAEVKGKQELLVNEIDTLKTNSTNNVADKIEVTKELVKKEKDVNILYEVENQLNKELEEKTRPIKDELAREIITNWDTPMHINYREVSQDYKLLDEEIQQKVKELEEKHNASAKEKTLIVGDMYKKIHEVLTDEDLILYEDAEKKLWVTDVIPISGVNHKLVDYIDRIKEGY
ncbi:hypothetical protein O5Y44_01835 [Gemella sp. 27098_8_155]|uniref:hypothetical protein n=1 Tax=Gemella sp. 27098_8_155 TaxID=3003688 RepID=UPI00352CF4A3